MGCWEVKFRTLRRSIDDEEEAVVDDWLTSFVGDPRVFPLSRSAKDRFQLAFHTSSES
jgi:hypothetical protein